MKLISLFILILIGSYGFTQNTNSYFGYIHSNLQFNFSGTSNELLLKYIKGGFLTDDMKNRILRKTKQNIRGGLIFQNQITFKVNKSKKIFISISDEELSGISIKKSYLELILRGNYAYRDKNLIFLPLSFKEMHYQKISISKNDIILPYKVNLNLSGFLLGINRQNQIHTGISQLYTNPSGLWLDIQISGKVTYTQPNQYGLFKGVGMGIELKFNYKREKRNTTLAIGNLGIGYFPQKSQIQWDSNFRFYGIPIGANIITSTSERKKFTDSLSKISYNSIQKNTLGLLPFRAEFQYLISHNATWNSLFIGDYIFLPGYLPRISYQQIYHKHQYYIRSTVSIGGHGDFDISATYSYLFQRILLSAQLFSLEGLLLPKTFSGGGIMLNCIFLQK